MSNYSPPLSIFFIWHPSNLKVVKPIVNFCSKMFSRDIKKPFSRGMNLPVFYRTSSKKEAPSNINLESEKSLIFLFISKNIVGDKDWIDYIDSIPENKNIHIIPIALDRLALNIKSRLKDRNFIRFYEYEDCFKNHLIFISIAHETYRYILNEEFSEIAFGKDNALKLFISHAKEGENGIILAKALKNFIDNSSMRNFFDATDIGIGYKFNEEIIGNIQQSTIIAIHSDPYSSKYWCQLEILTAKENKRPIVAVDCLEEFEDRRFPHAANIPFVHININKSKEVEKKDLLRIISAALLETVRFYYSKLLLNQYKKANWIHGDSEILARPPEAEDVFNLMTNDGKNIRILKNRFAYPEPPVYEEELDSLRRLGFEFNTLLSNKLVNIRNKKIGISISEPSKDDLIRIGQDSNHLTLLSQDISRYLLAFGSILIYGGDLRKNGFTDFIFKEAKVLQDRLKTSNIHIKNYISWPIYKRDTEAMIEWKAKYHHIATMEELNPPSDVIDMIPDINTYLSPTNVQNSYVWSRCLTDMRNRMIDECDVRICAGGRHSGYKGIMPGVLEEILIAIEKKKSVFLLGGFGGVTASICKYIKTQVINDELTEAWQIRNNAGYADILKFIDSRDEKYRIDYNSIIKTLNNSDLNNGLSDKDNDRLFLTPFIDEGLYLIFKGFKKLFHD